MNAWDRKAIGYVRDCNAQGFCPHRREVVWGSGSRPTAGTETRTRHRRLNALVSEGRLNEVPDEGMTAR